jgi:hypothetical protein
MEAANVPSSQPTKRGVMLVTAVAAEDKERGQSIKSRVKDRELWTTETKQWRRNVSDGR